MTLHRGKLLLPLLALDGVHRLLLPGVHVLQLLQVPAQYVHLILHRQLLRHLQLPGPQAPHLCNHQLLQALAQGAYVAQRQLRLASWSIAVPLVVAGAAAQGGVAQGGSAPHPEHLWQDQFTQQLAAGCQCAPQQALQAAQQCALSVRA
jgi:hypothetical protein